MAVSPTFFITRWAYFKTPAWKEASDVVPSRKACHFFCFSNHDKSLRQTVRVIERHVAGYTAFWYRSFVKTTHPHCHSLVVLVCAFIISDLSPSNSICLDFYQTPADNEQCVTFWSVNQEDRTFTYWTSCSAWLFSCLNPTGVQYFQVLCGPVHKLMHKPWHRFIHSLIFNVKLLVPPVFHSMPFTFSIFQVLRSKKIGKAEYGKTHPHPFLPHTGTQLNV